MLAKELINKYNAGQCTAEERAIVEQWFDHELRAKSEVQVSDQRLRVVKMGLPWMRKAKVKTFNYVWAAAACTVVALAISLSIWQYNSNSFNPEAEIFTKRASVVLPNGREVVLENILDPNDSILLRQNGLVVSMDGTIRLLDVTEGVEAAKEVITRIETPRGGEYKIELSDGTLVQLNAESSLEFPVQFVSNQRQVKLRGEAYFDVTKDEKRPFIVNAADKMDIKVLGTSFNVSTYKNNISTTLVKGSVKVSGLNYENAAATVIRPGETASIDNSGKIKVENIDVEKVIAWKNGLFNFNNGTIQHVAEELERWYDIKVVVNPDVADVKFYGEFERKQPLSNAMKLFEAVGVKVKLEGRVLKLFDNK